MKTSASTVLKFVAGAALAAGSIAAEAIPVVGIGQGSFSNLYNCDNSGSIQDCRIISSSDGANTEVQWGSQSLYSNFVNPSRLRANDVNINTETDANDVVIGALTWFNSATYGSRTPDDFGVSWLLSVAFSAPTVSSDAEVFDLRVSNPNNPTADQVRGFSLSDLGNLSFALSNVVVTDLRYNIIDLGGDSSAAGCGGADSFLQGSIWTNCEGNWSRLTITADFLEHRAVPEPATLALFGLGLLGLGIAGRRRRSL